MRFLFVFYCSKSKTKRKRNCFNFEDSRENVVYIRNNKCNKLSIRTNLNQLTVEKQNTLALKPFDDKHMYQNSIQKLPLENTPNKVDAILFL